MGWSFGAIGAEKRPSATLNGLCAAFVVDDRFNTKHHFLYSVHL
jgi:hypothetical protein